MKWIRDRLSAAGKSKDRTARQELIDHLIEVATSWEVRVVGRDSDGELLKVASGRDAVAAATVLLGYDMGKPTEGLSPLQLAEHLRQVERDRIAAVISVLGSKLKAMNPHELAEFFRECANDPGKFLAQAGEVMAEQTGEGLGPMPGVAELENASPNGCDMASHAPDATPGPGPLPEQKPESEP